MTISALFAPAAEILPFLVAFAAKATVILLLTAGISVLLWRSSAAVRHMVWCVGIVGVLALPLFSGLLPAWELPVLPAADAAPIVSSSEGAAAFPVASPGSSADPLPSGAAGPGAGLRGVLGLLAVGGALAGLLWLAGGLFAVARLRRGAELVRDADWLRAAQDASERLDLGRPVLLLRSRNAPMPATWGLLWPSVVLPSAADGWSEERRRQVLAHELAHVKRFDCLTQVLAQMACVLLWWHPVVWYAARRMRVERERACDDLVLAAGARASDYAAHLLEIAQAHRGSRLGGTAVLSMAQASQLESRLLWILDAAQARRAPSAGVAGLSLALGLLVAAPLAAVRPTQAADLDEAALSSTNLAAAHETHASSAVPSAPVRARVGSPPPVITTAVPTAEAAGGAAIAIAAREQEPGLGGSASSALNDAVALRSVGVDAAYVNELRAAGYQDLSSRQLARMKGAGVTAAYIAEMNASGYGRLTPDQLVSLNAVGVRADYVQELEGQGLTALSLTQLARLSSTGVTGEYVGQMRATGLHGLDVETLVQLKSVGITPAYLRELAAAGVGSFTPEQLIQQRTQGTGQPARP